MKVFSIKFWEVEGTVEQAGSIPFPPRFLNLTLFDFSLMGICGRPGIPTIDARVTL
jgi:hypothetical protein